jgi:LEA14-like dessication related protein
VFDLREVATAMDFEARRPSLRRRPCRARPVAACVCALLAIGCATLGREVEPPDVYVIDILPLEGTAFEQRVQVDLRVRNPNDFALEFDGVRFQLELNGKRFARGLGDQRVTVPRLGEARIEVITTTTMMDWVRQVAALSQPGRKVLDYRLSGRFFLADAAVGHVDFESSGNLSDASGLTTP